MKVYIETYGCALNRADSALMKRLLVSAGHIIVDSIHEADAIVINTCTVRSDTEGRILRRLSEVRRLAKGKKIVIAGCMVSAQPYTIKSVIPEASLISPQNITRIVDVLESPTTVHLITGERDVSYLSGSVSGAIATIPIAEGCIGDCSFCIVKIARRKLKSYNPKLIVNAVEEAVRQGAKEVELTAQDTASYGLDLGDTRLPVLVSMILENVRGDYMIRIGMANPDTLNDVLDGVIEILKHPNVFKFLHIPLQSADDNVLKIMKRKYTYDEFKSIVLEVRRKIPGVTIATDIIVGHPGEDEEAFQRTVEAVKELKFDRVHLAQYTIRPRTEAAAMSQVPDPIKKKRSSILAKVVEDVCLAINKEYIGAYAECLITHRGFRGHLIGRTINYRPVVIRVNGRPLTDSKYLGKSAIVYINDVTFYDLRGELEETIIGY
ncbi:MAG: tRNA (N(6)-L-threonylcarbamoyladenosine(37)-C(2))-methylthiotransferase [Desulfurococcales archaeon]|nr:tRNA (N(6)-L-threonylcarbamoyladenosine(37)-C(2))-methylthiotransferase [Desulfurococcales archaeon]